MAEIDIPELTDPAIPAFCADLPQRHVAFGACHRFADKHGFPLPHLTESKAADENSVNICGVAPDGRVFGIGYEWGERDG